jgi:hypothetical protein
MIRTCMFCCVCYERFSGWRKLDLVAPLCSGERAPHVAPVRVNFSSREYCAAPVFGLVFGYVYGAACTSTTERAVMLHNFYVRIGSFFSPKNLSLSNAR